MSVATKNRTVLGVESLDERAVPSGVAPAAGQEYGTGTLAFIGDLQAEGYRNLGEYCAEEGGECAAETLIALSPPGRR